MGSIDRFRLGIIGFGIGKLYASAFKSVGDYYAGLPPLELAAIATRSEASAGLAVHHYGFLKKTTNYRDLLDDDEINTIVIAAPNYLHHPMLVEALKTDKAIYTDKPLANTMSQAREIIQSARDRGSGAQLIFEMRFCPALQYACQLIQAGNLGEIYSFRAHYYRSSYVDPHKPLRWKGSARESGTGALGDLGAHIIDLVSWLIGSPRRVSARLRTVIPERLDREQTWIHVETDDHALIQAELPGGALGSFETSRVFNGAVNDMGLEIFGSHGAIRWNLMDGNYLYFVNSQLPAAERGWQQIPTVQTYPGALIPGNDVPVGMMRYHIASAYSFLKNTLEESPYDPGLEAGAHVQAVIEAAVISSREDTWVEVPCID